MNDELKYEIKLTASIIVRELYNKKLSKKSMHFKVEDNT